MKVRDGEPKNNEAFFLVQQAHGGPNVVHFLTRESAKGKELGILKLQTVYRDANDVATTLGYIADTEHESSGSPLFDAKSCNVIGLHKQGGARTLRFHRTCSWRAFVEFRRTTTALLRKDTACWKT